MNLYATVALQDRFDTALKAVCTQGMRGFAVLHAFLWDVRKKPLPQILQFIALLLSIPCFKAHQLFFEIAYAAGHRKLVRLGRKCKALGGKDLSVQFGELRLEGLSDAQIYHRLRDVADRLERCGQAGN